MLWSTPHGGEADPARVLLPEAIQAVSLEFGRFEAITALNPRFLPDRERLRLTIDMVPPPGTVLPAPSAFIERLTTVLPTLARHRCCGDNRIQQTFFAGGGHTCAATGRDAAGGDVTVDIAHLLEHVIIDLQHHIAEMEVCSGITCGYEQPRHRYDLFVESPGRSVSRLCVEMARSLMNEILGGAAPNRLYASAAHMARQFRRSSRGSIDVTAAARLVGEADAGRALSLLRANGFIREVETSIDFSRAPLFELAGS